MKIRAESFVKADKKRNKKLKNDLFVLKKQLQQKQPE